MRNNYFRALLLVSLILCSLAYQEKCFGHRTCIFQNDTIPPSYDFPNASVFDIDDSLLCTYFPEVGIKSVMKQPNRTLFSHTLQFHFTPNDSLKPDYLVITKQSLYNSLFMNLKQYAEDVHAIYGYGIYLETVDGGTAEDIKSLIQSYSSNLCGVLLVGDLGEAFFETLNDHGKNEVYRYWPCDLFFMDLDGVWLDTDNNGRYDQHTGDTSPEIFLGRLSAVGMSSLGNETSLIQAQLQKSHNYWWKSSYCTSDTVLNYIAKDWASDYFPPNRLLPVFPSGIVTDLRYGVSPTFSSTDFLSRLSNPQYGFTQLAAHSNPTTFEIDTNDCVYLSDIKQNNSCNYAYHLFCCNACNWTLASSQGYLGGAYLFNDGKTMAVIGTTKTGGMWHENNFFSVFPSMHIGDAFLNWWIISYGNNHTNDVIWWSYGMTLLGDPVIKFGHDVIDYCVENLVLTSYPENNHSNLVVYKASESICVSASFTIPQGVHVIFDAPQITIAAEFYCPLGASFETRSEGCEL